ncbi:response regulator [Solimicrobium silvestre]|nr:response regulator transcription factor [Solimicrobium silvestre]
MNILLADDHTIFRHGLKLLLDSQCGYQVVAEAASLDVVSSLLQQHPIDLMILDYNMPGGDSTAVLSYCKHRYADLKVIALTGSESGIVLKQLQDASADAVLRKDVSGSELLLCITKVMAGQVVVSADVQERIAESITNLTPRELQTVNMINDGLTNTDMAKRLNLSAKTIDKHRENLMRKLQVSNIAQLIHKAKLLGLV